MAGITTLRSQLEHGCRSMGATLRIDSLFMGDRGTLLAARHNALVRIVEPQTETVSCKDGDVFD